MARIVVIGGSQGAIHALQVIVRNLPDLFAAPILVVQHIGASPSLLPNVLNDAGGIHAEFALQGEKLVPGRIYVAPPDHHLIVDDGHCILSRGPRENWARPAIDPLFRSAAERHGSGVIAVLLSGRLNDGTAGLYEVKRKGGIAIVQSPAEAEAPEMPQGALNNVAVDYCLPVGEIPRLLTRLAAERAEVLSGGAAMDEEEIIAPSAQTCPECGGAMRKERVGSLVCYRCHIGHVMTAEVLAASQLQVIENELSALLRSLNERVGLCHDMAEKHRAEGREHLAVQWQNAAQEAAEREMAVRELGRKAWAHPETTVTVTDEVVIAPLPADHADDH